MASMSHFIGRSVRFLCWAASFFALLLIGLVVYLYTQLPSVDVLRDVQWQAPSSIYSADGLLMGEFGEQRRMPLSYEQIPPSLCKQF